MNSNKNLFLIKSQFKVIESEKIRMDSQSRSSLINCKDLEILDISDQEEEEEEEEDHKKSNESVKGYKTRLLSLAPIKGEPITTSKAIQMKSLVLGSALNAFPIEWLNQYFVFNENKSLFYGLIQTKGGPCGVLASIQSYLIIELFFNQNNSRDLDYCLAKAISHILWKIGRKSKAIVAHESNSIVMQRNHEIREDGITERIVFNEFQEFSSLFSHILQIIKNKSMGCVSFLYSCLLSRGLNQIKDDFDDKNIALIGKHNYCTQEMVNLLLIGKAVSNVFNNDIKCDSLTLHGVFGCSEIGFLSLFEYYQSFEVGSNYKCPQFPVFVILSESHFSVLFSKQRIEKKRQFDLFYYDGLALQEEEIILNIKLDSNDWSETSTIVPLECVIKTKWKNATISWNTKEKIL